MISRGSFARKLRLGLGLLVAFAASACAPDVAFHTAVNQQRAQGNYDDALKIFEEHKTKYGKSEQLLAEYERGVLLYYDKKFDEALKVLEDADRMGEELYTTSVTRSISTGIVNDTMSEYSGEDFERVMVNILKALIYAEKGDTEAALVEARKVDEKLAVYNTKYEESKNVYTEDAFGRFISGILYMSSGTSTDLQDANVAFRKAFEIYSKDYLKNYGTSVPQELKVASAEAAKISGDQPPPGADEVPVDFSPADYGEVVVVQMNGLVPKKVEKHWIVPTPDGKVIKVAYPEYVDRQYANRGSVVRATRVEATPPAGAAPAENTPSSASTPAAAVTLASAPVSPSAATPELPRSIVSASTELVQPVGGIAKKCLEDRIGRIKAKAVARALAKYAATKATEEALKGKGGNDLLSMGVGLAMTALAVASENADTRHWAFLPDEIRLARLRLAPGTYNLTAQLTVGRAISLGQVTVAAGKAKVVSFESSN